MSSNVKIYISNKKIAHKTLCESFGRRQENKNTKRKNCKWEKKKRRTITYMLSYVTEKVWEASYDKQLEQQKQQQPSLLYQVFCFLSETQTKRIYFPFSSPAMLQWSCLFSWITSQSCEISFLLSSLHCLSLFPSIYLWWQKVIKITQDDDHRWIDDDRFRWTVQFTV